VRPRWERFWFDPAPLSRVAVLRLIVYAYLPLDVVLTRFPAAHGLLPTSWYAPLWIGRLLRIPAPTPRGMLVTICGIFALAPIAAAGRARRVVGPVLFGLYAYWCYIGFSYGKVDHDRVALLVALAVLPTVEWASTREDRVAANAGWTLRAIQVSVVLVYLLSAVTKLRVSGPGWVASSILVFAILRRGTMLGDPLLHFPWLLRIAQGGILALEAGSPLLLLRSRLGRAYLFLVAAFHLVSFATITISFRPHVVCLAAFLPLERLWARQWIRPRDAVARTT
jgi:hypothetical protein